MQVSRVSKVEFGKSHVVEYRYKVFGLFPVIRITIVHGDGLDDCLEKAVEEKTGHKDVTIISYT